MDDMRRTVKSKALNCLVWFKGETVMASDGLSEGHQKDLPALLRACFLLPASKN
jgi:hypothetical protein